MRKSGTSPTARTLKWLRDQGYDADKVEQPWNPHSKVTRDLYGFGDVLAFRDSAVVIVQVTSTDNLASRHEKVAASPIARRWLNIPMAIRQIELHGWALRGEAGKRKRWTLRRLSGRLASDGEILFDLMQEPQK